MRVWAALILSVLSLVGGFTSIGRAATNIELQERCGQLATKYFYGEYGSGTYKNNFVDPDTHKTLYDETRSTFVNHHNIKEDRCLAVIASMNVTKFEKIENSAIWILVIDLTERRIIGMFHQLNTRTDVCFIENQDCGSMNEWELFLWPYMHD